MSHTEHEGRSASAMSHTPAAAAAPPTPVAAPPPGAADNATDWEAVDKAELLGTL